MDDIDTGALREELSQAAAGNAASWRSLLGRHHDRLRRMVAVRLDTRLQGRVDPSDVLQEAYLDAASQLHDYLFDPQVPIFLWLRSLTCTHLAKVHRAHLNVQARDVRRERSIQVQQSPSASSVAMAASLMDRGPRPSQAAMLAEARQHLEAALDSMKEDDREILALRHFEQLTAGEAARVLGISEAAARKRYLRALGKLR